MPADVAMVVTGIVLAFALFAGVLAWADFYTKGRSPVAAE